jgi:pimeloyl-ACP methyl ester carboxylesterase
MRIEVDGVELEVSSQGSGPAVLLLHGFPDTHGLWLHQVPALTAAGFRTIAPDLRGFGASDRPGEYGMGAHVGDLLGVLDRLEVPAAHVVGHDWGAAIGWALASLAPDRVRSLAALSVGHPAAFARGGVAQREKSWYMLLFQFEGVAEQWLAANDFANLREWSGHPDADAVAARLAEPGALTAALGIYRDSLPPSSLVSPPPSLPPVAAPTLGVWSTGDRFLLEGPMVASEAFVAGPWRYARVDAAGHWLQLDNPDAVNGLLLDFLGSCSPAASRAEPLAVVARAGGSD